MKEFHKQFMPIFVAAGIHRGSRGTFYVRNQIISVTIPNGLMQDLLRMCDGRHNLREILSLLSKRWDKRILNNFITELVRNGVLCDSRSIIQSQWSFIENPSHFPLHITDNKVALLVKQAKERHKNQPSESDKVYQASPSSLGKLLDRRRSVRSFSGQSIELQSIVDMLWSAYGEVHVSKDDGTLMTNCRRTVPSAGALYPLMIHVALFKETEELHPGIYSAWMGSPGTVGFNLVSEDTARLIRSFADPLMLDKAHGVIIISGSLHTTGEKYGNRSMLYVTLEIGHAAQNIHIAASESEVAIVEIGGFVEELLAKAIELPKHYRPMTTVVFGHEDKMTQDNISKSEVEIDWAIPIADQYQLPFTMAFAKMSFEADDDWACGRAVLPKLAYTKAVAEAREWAACECVSDELVYAKLTDLETAIDPRKIIAFHPAQYRLKGFPLKPFSEKVEYAWVEGGDELQRSKVHVLADCVYYPYFSKAPRYSHASSSGVAAYPERQQAIKNGVLELIERDSFMIAYLTRLSLPTVIEKTIPKEIYKRIGELRKNGFRIWVKDYSLDLAPVVFIFAQSENLKFTTCAGCANFDTEEAFDHALMEIESSVLCRFANGPSKPIEQFEVRLPRDHGRLYEQKRFFRKADFLAYSRDFVRFQKVGRDTAQSWQELLDRFVKKNWRLITIPLNLTKKYGGNNGLHIVRSIVPGMVPISFGYQQMPYGMERIRLIAKEIEGISISYRDMSKFPHPYT